MASVKSISAPFLPVLELAILDHFQSWFSTSVLYTAQWQLMTMGITFDNGPDGLSTTPCLQVDPSFPK